MNIQDPLKKKVSRNPEVQDPHLENLHFKGKCTHYQELTVVVTVTQVSVLLTPKHPHQTSKRGPHCVEELRCGCLMSIVRIPSTASLGALWNHQEHLKTYPCPCAPQKL